MKISDMLKMPVGTPIGGFTKTIKTAKKKWQAKASGKEVWMHQVVLSDETGDILTDVKIGGYSPLIRGSEIRVIVGQIQQSEKGVKLYVDQFIKPADIGDPENVAGFYDNFNNESVQVIRSKIKCWLVAACLQGGKEIIADHIKSFRFFPKLRYVIDNGRTLCNKCHKKTETYGRRSICYA